jgi:hypothetical protein
VRQGSAAVVTTAMQRPGEASELWRCRRVCCSLRFAYDSASDGLLKMRKSQECMAVAGNAEPYPPQTKDIPKNKSNAEHYALLDQSLHRHASDCVRLIAIVTVLNCKPLYCLCNTT